MGGILLVLGLKPSGEPATVGANPKSFKICAESRSGVIAACPELQLSKVLYYREDEGNCILPGWRVFRVLDIS